MSSVVVGVDGSDHASAALRMAVREAGYRAADLHVVYVYAPPRASHVAAASVAATGSWPTEDAGATVLRDARRRDDEDRAAGQRHADAWLRQYVQEHGVDVDDSGVRLNALTNEHPAAALVRLSSDADLLVVGSRGVGGFAAMLLGSIGQHCVRHAICPVLVTRTHGAGASRRLSRTEPSQQPRA